MNIGDILYFSDYEFCDGGHADKLLVVLAFSADKEDVLLVIATSTGGKRKIRVASQSRKSFSFVAVVRFRRIHGLTFRESLPCSKRRKSHLKCRTAAG
ncbi:MAG: hypothetical protein LBN96_01710 [Desulfovibrio sp.]|jgi:hypothetical protein|nr:hypothetical protein [Desulfovibrio sp.]